MTLDPRFRGVTSAQDLMDLMLYSTIPWPGKTRRPAPDSVLDARQRSMTGDVSVAELYHENSNMFPMGARSCAFSKVAPDAVRAEFLQRRTAWAQDLPAAEAPSLDRWRQLVAAVAVNLDPRLLYALDLRVGDAAVLAALEVQAGGKLLPVRATTAEEFAGVTAAVWGDGQPVGGDSGLLFVVGSFVRNEVLFGSRGYRHTLLEAGRLVQGLVAGAAAAGVTLRPTAQFVDRVVNEFVAADGTEEGTIVVCEALVGDGS